MQDMIDHAKAMELVKSHAEGMVSGNPEMVNKLNSQFKKKKMTPVLKQIKVILKIMVVNTHTPLRVQLKELSATTARNLTIS